MPHLLLVLELEELDLSYNKLTYLPPSIGKLSKLKKLNLSGNRISYLPKEFENLVELKSLDMSGNPIENVPVEISAQGPQGVINYYLSLGDNVLLFEAKLLIVGQGNVGKTYLMNRLILDSTPETGTTEGIDINTWMIETQSSPEFRVNVWDFGGQEIYHSTHQFFLTKRSLYLLVWEARTDQHLISFDYWLNVIKLLSNSSPTIVVLNKIDERIASLDERSIEYEMGLAMFGTLDDQQQQQGGPSQREFYERSSKNDRHHHHHHHAPNKSLDMDAYERMRLQLTGTTSSPSPNAMMMAAASSPVSPHPHHDEVSSSSAGGYSSSAGEQHFMMETSSPSWEATAAVAGNNGFDLDWVKLSTNQFPTTAIYQQ